MKSLSKVFVIAALLSGTSVINAAANTKPMMTSHAAFNTEDRHLTGFNAVDASGSFDVYIVQGNTESVKVDAPADIINRITTKVEGGVLKLGTKNNNGWNWNWNSNERIIIYVAVKNINTVSLTGSGDISFKDGLRANNLKIKLSGSGNIIGKVEAQDLESSISGSGDIKLSGRANSSSISISGSGDYTAASLVTEDTAVRISGSGDVRVNVNSKIDASMSGSGDVYYSGNAKQINTSKHGSGEVHHI